MSDLVKRLRGRNGFFSIDPGRWYMSDSKDADCTEAADRIEKLEHTLLLAKTALEYHVQQTRPINGTTWTIEAIGEVLK